jgi:hypothetical protein
MTTQSPAEILGAYTGVLGAGAMAIGFPFPGFCLFAVSNVAWIYFAKKHAHKHLRLMNYAYMVTTVYGLIHWA